MSGEMDYKLHIITVCLDFKEFGSKSEDTRNRLGRKQTVLEHLLA